MESGDEPRRGLRPWFLNLFPRPEPFLYDPLGNQTLNFVPTIATMTIGVGAGELLRSGRPAAEKRADCSLGARYWWRQEFS